jgi:hypothetical protein
MGWGWDGGLPVEIEAGTGKRGGAEETSENAPTSLPRFPLPFLTQMKVFPSSWFPLWGNPICWAPTNLDLFPPRDGGV